MWRATKPLELVHTDVCSPMRTLSLNGSRYFLLFIDDYTRMTWVYFLKERSEVYGVFKKFKQLVETQSGHKLKTLRSDRGTEYKSHHFDKFCEEEGVERQLSVAYTPQQNGVSERKNRTIMEMARSMLYDKELPRMFWAEAVNTAVYLLNRCPTKAVSDQTPFQAWNGKRPSAAYLKVFGCVCYMHVPDQKRTKLEEKSKKGIFLGFSTLSKGYRIYNLETKKLVTSRDVVFDEKAVWKWDEENLSQPNIITSEENSENDHEFTENAEPSSPDSPPRKSRLLSEIYESCNVSFVEPHNFAEASKESVWIKAMEEEMQMIEENNTWELVNRPSNKDVIGVKWIFKTKLNPDKTVQKFKARLVDKGYAQ